MNYNSFEQSNYKTIVNQLTDTFQKTENEDPNVNKIWEAITIAKQCCQNFNTYKQKIDSYNYAVDRIQAYQKAFNLPKKYPFNTTAAENALIDNIVSQVKEGEEFYNYKETKIHEDISTINNLNFKLEAIGKQGYQAIMDLRRLLTGQEIIYAVQGIKNKNQLYREFLTEEDFLKLTKTKAQYNISANLRKINKETFSGASLQVDYQNILAKIPKVSSKDSLYEAISQYTNEEKGKHLRPSEAWEVYTEAKRVFNNTDLTEESFKNFMGDWLLLKKATYQKIIDLNNKTATRSFSTLPFYQGGDTSTFSKYVVIQNKSSWGSYAEASINIRTIYNALQYISQIFTESKQIDKEAVKKLFTAYKLSEIPKNIANQGFLEANSYAQEMIEKTVAQLNNSKK